MLIWACRMQYSKLGFGQAGRVFASWRGVSPAGNQTMQVAAGRQWMGTGQRWGVHALLVAFGCACFLLALYRHEHEAAITKTPMGNTDSLLIIITVSRPLQNRGEGKKSYFILSTPPPACMMHLCPCWCLSQRPAGQAHLAGVWY